MKTKSLNKGSKVVLNRDIVIIQEGEEQLIGKSAIVSEKDDFTFPIELEFKDPNVQQLYNDLGKRRFDEFELTLK